MKLAASPPPGSLQAGARVIAWRSFSGLLALGACAHNGSDRILERAASLPPGQTCAILRR